MIRVPLAAKAEVSLGVHLVVRHRTVRLAGVFAAIVLIWSAGTSAQTLPIGTVTIVAGSLAAVAGSRLLAPGPAVWAARRSGGTAWLAPAGRLIGLLLALAPIVLIAAIAGGSHAPDAPALAVAWVAFVYGGAIGALTMAAAPMLGASAAGTIGLLAAWFGGLRPSAVAELLGGWPYVMRPAVVVWNVLPLQWRAVRLGESSSVFTGTDAWLLLGWIPAGIALAAWAALRQPSATGRLT